MSNRANEIKKEIVFYSKLMEEKGLVNAFEGNLSMIDRESGELYITPTTERKSLLNEDMISVLKNDKQIAGSSKHSSEYLLHVAALNARQDCVAAVHTHATYLTAYAYCNQGIKLECSTAFCLLFEDIPCLPYGEPGTTGIAAGIENVLKDRCLILLGNHGCISVGRSLEEAVSLIEVAEETLKIYHTTKQIGDIKNIPSDELEALMTNHHASIRNRYK